MSLNREYPQVRCFMQSNEVNIEHATIEYIRRWILILKKMKKKAIKYKGKEDICGYFASRNEI